MSYPEYDSKSMAALQRAVKAKGCRGSKAREHLIRILEGLEPCLPPIQRRERKRAEAKRPKAKRKTSVEIKKEIAKKFHVEHGIPRVKREELERALITGPPIEWVHKKDIPNIFSHYDVRDYERMSLPLRYQMVDTIFATGQVPPEWMNPEDVQQQAMRMGMTPLHQHTTDQKIQALERVSREFRLRSTRSYTNYTKSRKELLLKHTPIAEAVINKLLGMLKPSLTSGLRASDQKKKLALHPSFVEHLRFMYGTAKNPRWSTKRGLLMKGSINHAAYDGNDMLIIRDYDSYQIVSMRTLSRSDARKKASALVRDNHFEMVHDYTTIYVLTPELDRMMYLMSEQR